MSLSDWLRYGWLTEHETSSEEVRGLLEIIERDLADSQLEALSPDWRLNIAYNAALQAATMALAVCGEALEATQLARELAVEIRRWLSDQHPEWL